MSYYETKLKVFKELNVLIINWYERGSEPLDIKRLIFEMTLKYEIGELTVRKRIMMYPSSILNDNIKHDRETDTLIKV